MNLELENRILQIVNKKKEQNIINPPKQSHIKINKNFGSTDTATFIYDLPPTSEEYRQNI